MTGWHATDSLWSFQRKFVGLWAVDSATPPVMGRIGGNRVGSGVSDIIHVHKLKYSMIYASSTNLLNLFESKFWKHHTSLSYLGGGFKYAFIFTPTWGRFPFWLIFFKRLETASQIYSEKVIKQKYLVAAPVLWFHSSGIVQMFLKLGWKMLNTMKFAWLSFVAWFEHTVDGSESTAYGQLRGTVGFIPPSSSWAT